MPTELIMTVVVSLLGGGGLVAIVNAFVGRRRNKSEVTDINVKTAIELEKMAMQRYNEASESLDNAYKLLNESKHELMDLRKEMTELKRELDEVKCDFETYYTYAKLLKSVLQDNDIPVPSKPKG